MSSPSYAYYLSILARIDPRRAAAQMILNVENRPRWDDLCDHGSVVKRLGPCSDIIYLSYQGKLGVCARDLCLLRCPPPPRNRRRGAALGRR